MMTMLRKPLVAAVCIALALGAAIASAQTVTQNYTPSVGQAGKDVVWVPTPQSLVDQMLDMARLTPRDRLVDLGSGDGRTVITAAKRGATARGIEFNPDMVALSRQRAQAEGVADRATFEQGDIFESDFSDATVVTLFLLSSLNVKLRPILLDMPPGTRIVANTFDMGEWKPDQTARVTAGCSSYCTALKWIVPAKVAGTWVMDDKQLELTQDFQMLEGTLRDATSASPLTDGRLAGTRVIFSVGSDVYVGEVDGNRMRGTINGSRPWQATRAAQS